MPPQNGVGLHHAGQSDEAWPQSCQPDQHRPVASMQPQTARCTSQGNSELMPKKQVLDFKLVPRPSPLFPQKRPLPDDGWMSCGSIY
jgi:hypothetical protein